MKNEYRRGVAGCDELDENSEVYGKEHLKNKEEIQKFEKSCEHRRKYLEERDQSKLGKSILTNAPIEEAEKAQLSKLVQRKKTNEIQKKMTKAQVGPPYSFGEFKGNKFYYLLIPKKEN